MLPRLLMRLLIGLMQLFATFLRLLVTLVMTTFCGGSSNALAMMQTPLDLLLRGSLATRFGIWPAWLITFLLITVVATLILLVLLRIAAGFSTAMWLGWLASLWIHFLTCILDATTLQKVFLHLLARQCNELKAFSTSTTAPIMTDHYMVQECAIIFHDICTDRATGYPGFLFQLSLIRGEYGDAWQSQLWMQFLQESQWHDVATFKYYDGKRPPKVFHLQ